MPKNELLDIINQIFTNFERFKFSKSLCDTSIKHPLSVHNENSALKNKHWLVA